MYDIFISYSFKDEQKALDMVNKIEKEVCPCWISCRNILVSGSFAASISQAIHNTKIVIVLLSESSNQSKHVPREISLAVKNDISILPVSLEPVSLSEGMDYWLTSIERLGPVDNYETLTNKVIEWLRDFFKDHSQEEAPFDISIRKNNPGTRIDIYDEEMEYVGSALKEKVHQLGLWHKTFHCWLYHNDNGKALLWVQRRSEKKKDFPRMLDITVGRHLLEGESDLEAAERVSQEIGAKIVFEDLNYIGVRSCREEIGSFKNNELNSVFLYEAPYSIGELIPNLDEISGMLQIDANDMLALFEHRTDTIPAIEMALGKSKNLSLINVSRDDFVPHDDEYYREICSSVIKLCR